MEAEHIKSVLHDVLPLAKNNRDISDLAGEIHLQPRYPLNLDSCDDYEKVLGARDRLLGKTASSELLPVDAQLLANVVYLDMCDRQSDAIAAELLNHDELGTEYYTSVFLKLVENYHLCTESIRQGVVDSYGEESADAMLQQALDIVFVQRFSAFSRYDRWEISDPLNQEMQNNPNRAMLELLNNDLCVGAFWDESVSLKNKLVRERLGEAVEFMMNEKFVSDGMIFSSEAAGWFSGINQENPSRVIYRLTDIISGDGGDVSSLSLDADRSRLESVCAEARKAQKTGMADVMNFTAGMQTDNGRSLADLVTELEKLKGPQKNGAHIK